LEAFMVRNLVGTGNLKDMKASWGFRV
jgi:hypothetical protein